MAKAVIFDVDGTLVDSVDLHARAWQDAFHDYGHDLEFEDIRSQIGKGGDQLMPVFLDPGELEARERRSKSIEVRSYARGTCTRSRPSRTCVRCFSNSNLMASRSPSPLQPKRASSRNTSNWRRSRI